MQLRPRRSTQPLGMPRAQHRILGRGAILAAALSLCACSGAETVAPLSLERAIELSREAATKHGYDLTKYTLDAFGDPKAGGEGEWFIGYICHPDPPAPGCHFLVVVDRTTGSAKVVPGE